MSDESFDVQQRKDPKSVVHWNEYAALRDHLTNQFNSACDGIQEDVRAIDLKLAETQDTMHTTRETMTTLQQSVTDLTHAVAALQASVDQRRLREQDDDLDDDGEASVHGGHVADAAANAAPAANILVHGGRGHGGRGNGGRGGGRGFAVFGARRENDIQQPLRDEDGLGKPKFSIPTFEGSTDVEEYLSWELKIERLWRLHEYSEDRKIKLASSEFDGYALRW